MMTNRSSFGRFSVGEFSLALSLTLFSSFAWVGNAQAAVPGGASALSQGDPSTGVIKQGKRNVASRPSPDQFRRCFSVHSSILSEVTMDDCASPVGFCTQGKVKGLGPVKGRSYYTTYAMGPTAADPGMETSLSYTGSLVVKTPRGDLQVTDLGVIDQTGGTFSETSRNVSGNGLFEDVSGNLFVYGKATNTGFDGVIRGKLCVGTPRGGIESRLP